MPFERSRRVESEPSAAWNRHAADWIRWARTPEHDSYWRWHRDQFLELVPPPGRATLDVGCGEGRLARDLATLGHNVTGIDASPVMIEAASHESPNLTFVEADAASLPFADATFECVIAFMSFQDLDDLDGAAREAARVTEPGGTCCLAIVHPFNSAGLFEERERGARFVIDGSYLASSYYTDDTERDGLTMQFVSVHRPIQAYVQALTDAGLMIDMLRETDVPSEFDETERWQRMPMFLHLRAQKPS